MIYRIIYFIFILAIVTLSVVEGSSCRVRKEYIEKHGLHSDKKPSELAKDLGNLSKKHKRAYKKQLRRTAKAIKKRNMQKIKGGYFDKGTSKNSNLPAVGR